MNDKREIQIIGFDWEEFIGNMILMLLTVCLSGSVMVFAYNKLAEPLQYGREHASSMREVSDSVLATKDLFSMGVPAPDAELIGYWDYYSKSLDQFTREEASVVAGILCDISQHSCYKRTEYILVEEQSLSPEQIEFFISKGYTVDSENGIISW